MGKTFKKFTMLGLLGVPDMIKGIFGGGDTQPAQQVQTTQPANSPTMDDAAVQAARDAEKRKLRTSNMNDNTGGLLATDYGKPTVLGG